MLGKSKSDGIARGINTIFACAHLFKIKDDLPAPVNRHDRVDHQAADRRRNRDNDRLDNGIGQLKAERVAWAAGRAVCIAAGQLSALLPRLAIRSVSTPLSNNTWRTSVWSRLLANSAASHLREGRVSVTDDR